MDNQVITKIRQQLMTSADEKTRLSGQRFFKEAVTLHGVKASVVQKIAKEGFTALPNKEKKFVFEVCEELWNSGFLEETFVACEWSYRMHNAFVPSDMVLFERWVSTYITNWASCDTFCNHTIGEFVEMFPDHIETLKRWAKSENRWMRRASAVSLIIPARKGLFLPDIFEIATLLLTDSDDMVQKGYGWMLKAASQKNLQPVFEFVLANKKVMPRTALRYAIEKMPQELREMAMKK
jgi:3-methyladenine DNA glycosylase AlkD